MDVFSNIPTFSNGGFPISFVQVIVGISPAALLVCRQLQPRLPRVGLRRGHEAKAWLRNSGSFLVSQTFFGHSHGRTCVTKGET